MAIDREDFRIAGVEEEGWRVTVVLEIVGEVPWDFVGPRWTIVNGSDGLRRRRT